MLISAGCNPLRMGEVSFPEWPRRRRWIDSRPAYRSVKNRTADKMVFTEELEVTNSTTASVIDLYTDATQLDRGSP